MFPAVKAVARLLVGTASTDTEVRPWAIVRELPSVTVSPSTLKVDSEVSFEKAGAERTTVTVYVVLLVPFAAVTSTETVLFPTTNPVPPVITTAAFESVASATTSTEVTSLATVTDPPSTTSVPSTAKTPRLVSSFWAT